MDDLHVPPGGVVNVRLPVATANGNDLVPCPDKAGYQIAPDMTCGPHYDDSHEH
jgi:hypothetical protein